MNQLNLNKLPFIFNGKFFEVNFFDEGTGKISAYCQECSKIGKTKLIQGSTKPTSNFTTHLKVV
jgi:hypothetical protein